MDRRSGPPKPRGEHARQRQRGQALVEYAFLLILMVTVAIAIFMVVGNQVRNEYQTIQNEVQRAISGG